MSNPNLRRNFESKSNLDLPENGNAHLLRQVPPKATRILYIGCEKDRLCLDLKAMYPDRQILGTKVDLRLLNAAKDTFNIFFEVGVPNEQIQVDSASLDCIILNDAIEILQDPLAVILLLKNLVKPDGCFIASFNNASHYSVISSLISGDLQYGNSGALSRGNINLLASTNVQKIFLDAGCLPSFLDSIKTPVPSGMMDALRSVADQLRLNIDLLNDNISTLKTICKATPIGQSKVVGSKILFVCAVNNRKQFDDNLKASPIFRNPHHRIIGVLNATSISNALRRAIDHAQGEWDAVVLVHQDVYLPLGWDHRLMEGVKSARQKFGDVDVVGVFGVVSSSGLPRFRRTGVVVDRKNLLCGNDDFPVQASSLDELVLAFPMDGKKYPEIAPELGFHFYGSEVCVKAMHNHSNAVIIKAPCLHNTQTTYDLSQEAFLSSGREFLEQCHPPLPFATTCIIIDQNGRIFEW